MRWFGILLSTTMAVAPAAPLQAQEPPTGDLKLTAVGYAVIPEGAAFRLQAMEDTELNQHVLRLLATELHARNYEVRTEAPFVVTIDTEPAWVARPARGDLGEFDIDSGLELEFMVNLWSTTERSLLGGAEKATAIDKDYRLGLSIHDVEHGHYVWIGEVVDLREGQNPFIAGQVMVSTLLDAMGETVPLRMITLREGAD